MLGTHNSFTYFKPEHWWGYLMIPFAKCQTKTWEEQWDAGVRCFDIRARLTKYGPRFAHGWLILDGLFHKTITDIMWRAKKTGEPVYLRLVLEDKRKKEADKEWFFNLCEEYDEIAAYNPEIVPFEGRRKGDWALIFTFGVSPTVFQPVSSMAKDARWYERFIPWLYAKRKNKDLSFEGLKEGTAITLVDFL